MDNTRHKPVVFVSSTCYDLKPIREELKEFFEENYGFQTMLSEFDSFPVDPCKGTFENCIDNVDKLADIFILIIGSRYGYVTQNGKSITNLEYLHAKEKGIPIYVFVDKQLYSNMMVWKTNRDADYSNVVDNVKLFEFVLGIYEESKQWVYTYNYVREIKITLKQQLSLIFCDGLILKKVVGDSYNRIINADIPTDAVRVFIEKPYAWEYKFFAYVLKNEFDRLQSNRWDFIYGIYSVPAIHLEREELLNDISNKFNEICSLIEMISTLINSALSEAIGDPGIESNLDMMIYVSKQIAYIYKRLIEWGLYFKSIHTEDVFEKLLAMLCELPRYMMDQIDEFVVNAFKELTDIPDVNDGKLKNIVLNCVLDGANTEDICREMERLTAIFNNRSF